MRRALVDYVGPNDNEYVVRMHEIVTAQPLGGTFSDPVEILPHVILGSQLHAESLRQLRRNKITHVLNCAGYTGPREFPDKSPYEGLAIDYYEFKASDEDEYDITQHFGESIKYINRAFQKGGKVLVHCAMGINRSVAVCVAYLLHHKNWPLLKATSYVKDRRRLCLSNDGFRVQLVKYARARGLLDQLPPRRRRDRYGDLDDPRAERARELSRSLPSIRDPQISTILAKGHFQRSDSLLDTGLMFRIERFMNREKV